MITNKIKLIAFCFLFSMVSCNKDEDTITPEPIRDRGVQQIADNEALLSYLKNHYYNHDEIESFSQPSITDIKITKLEESTTMPDGNMMLIDAVDSKAIIYEGVNYEYYVLKIKQGSGNSPTFADNVLVLYEGFTLENNVFDSKNFPDNNTFNLASLIQGWRNVLPDFNAAGSFAEDTDGTVTYSDTGLGVMFLPSGLAYFSSAPVGISSYAPLVFKFELLAMEQNDEDSDGIPSYLEDIDNNGNLLNDNTDNDTYFDSSGFVISRYNFIDPDDDGDGILTKDEIEVTTINGVSREAVKSSPLEANQVLLNKIKKETDGTFTGTIVTLKDANNNGTPDYLEKSN